MTWALAIELLVRYGPEAAARIFSVIQENPEPTKEAFDKVVALATKPMDEYIKEAEERAKLK